MPTAPGSRIGPYEVTAQLGEGAMGVVFRARDTKLLRDVALKVLPDHFADDQDRLSRLQREAQLLASLNHPNIAQVYGLEEQETRDRQGRTVALVMELVAGETLEDKLKNGPLPVDEAIEIATQIADALAAAHERGIVHRDLKPANIKLTPSGAVKVLDFGLAKPLAYKSVGTGSSTLPTIASGSIAGAIVGTVAYMSPEQARGKDVDARTDIWAFGCVLYEMLTARLAFDGETVTDTIAKIVTAQPDLSALPPAVPVPIRLLLTATLNKNIQQRLQHVGDMRLFLDQNLFPVGAAPTQAGRVAGRASRGPWLIAALVAGLAAALLAVVLYTRPGPPQVGPALQLEAALPGYVSAVAVSPNGQRIAYVAEPQGEKRAIWIRAAGSEAAQKLAGTDNPQSEIEWSPDGGSLAFVNDGKLKKIEVGSGSIQAICDVTGPARGFTWSRSGVILFARSNGLAQVSAAGGTIAAVTELDANRKETIHGLPVFLPDGNHFLYVILSSIPEITEKLGIFVGSLDGKTKTRLMPVGARIAELAYASGYVLVAGESLVAQRFDPSTLKLEGSPVALADAVDGLSVSETGLLLYRKASATAANKQLTWLDRAGRQLGSVATPANYGNVELSPNGDRVAVDILTNNNRDVWVIDLARGVPSRITFDPGPDWTPAWSPDGSRIAFAAGRAGGTQIYQKASSGVGNDEPLFKLTNAIPVSWSRDGRYVVFSRLRGGTGGGTGAGGADTWLLSLSGEPKASPFIESPFDKAQARISPDSRFIAYATNDSGLHQIVVQSFPDPNGGRWQITAQGGIEPKWRHDGRELYYLAFDGKMMAVPVNPARADRRFEAGTPSALFETPLVVSRTQAPRDRRYDVAPDGRFLMAAPAATMGPLPVTAVVNWAAGLDKK
jgi:Tol biopolymer transport system component/tRNA A-37 threonylcarbamoyl transferase component Bud32